MRYPSREDWVYLAGIVDGEGSICISHGRRSFDVSVCVGMTAKALLDWIAETFGGAIYPKVSLGRPMWQWKLTGDSAVPILRRLQPFLKVKQQQAWLAQEAWAQRTSGARFGTRSLDHEEQALRRGYALACSYLNRGR